MKEKILVIDDEAEIRGVLMEVLQEEGFEVIEACDGVEGLQIFHKEKPDRVITDVKMPRKDGLAVLKEVKESGSDTDVIILTGPAMKPRQWSAFDQGPMIICSSLWKILTSCSWLFTGLLKKENLQCKTYYCSNNWRNWQSEIL
jgi:CheY-like chemotaxis protein